MSAYPLARFQANRGAKSNATLAVVRASVERETQIMCPICRTYAQDYACLGYPLPMICTRCATTQAGTGQHRTAKVSTKVGGRDVVGDLGKMATKKKVISAGQRLVPATSAKGVCTASCKCEGDPEPPSQHAVACGEWCCRYWHTHWKAHPEDCWISKARRPLRQLYCGAHSINSS